MNHNETAGIDLDKLEALARAAAEHGDAIGEEEWYSADENVSVFVGNPDLALIAACSPVALLQMIERARRSTTANDEHVLRFAIEVEKQLCQALGREWSVTGISIDSLIAELARKAASGSDGTAAAGAGDVELIRVPAHEADSYCRILSILGMEEEGDPVAEVQRLFDADMAATSGSELADELPPLPEPKYAADDLTDIFTADQMREYARAALAKQAGAPALIQALETGDERESSHWFDISAGEVSTYTEEGYRVRYLYERAAPAPAAQDERDAKDAARYRWLRDHPWSFELPTLARVIQLQQNALWDEQIDAAMSQSKTQGTAGQDGQNG